MRRRHRVDRRCRMTGSLVQDPVRPAVPLIARHADGPKPRPLNRRPVHRQALGVEHPEGGEHHRALVLATPERRDGQTFAAVPLQALRDGGSQHRMRADLDEERDLLLDEGIHRRPELHRRLHVASPVPRIHGRGIDATPGHRRGQGHVHRRGSQIAQTLRETSRRSGHLRAVKRVVHREHPARHPLRLECGHHAGQGLRLAGEDHRLGTVDRRDGQALLVRAQCFGGTLRAHLDRGHAPAARRLVHQAAAVERDLDRLIERERARRVRRRDLAHAVPDHRVRSHAPRTPQRHETGLEREDRRLRDVGTVETRDRLARAQLRQQGELRARSAVGRIP